MSAVSHGVRRLNFERCHWIHWPIVLVVDADVVNRYAVVRTNAERAMNVSANQRLRPRALDRGKQFNGTDVLQIRTGQFAIAVTARRLMRYDQVGSARDCVVDAGEVFRIAEKGPVAWKSIAPGADPNRQA